MQESDEWKFIETQLHLAREKTIDDIAECDTVNDIYKAQGRLDYINLLLNLPTAALNGIELAERMEIHDANMKEQAEDYGRRRRDSVTGRWWLRFTGQR